MTEEVYLPIFNAWDVHGGQNWNEKIWLDEPDLDTILSDGLYMLSPLH